jgi:ferredoxin
MKTEYEYMKRKIREINEERCNGCGLCVDACHEGALQIVEGKAKLVSESYCDGLGDCLPECPVDAIRIIEKESLPFDPEAVKKNMEKGHGCTSCPGSRSMTINTSHEECHSCKSDSPAVQSQLRQWPVQIKLVPVNAPYFNGSRLLIAADCSAYAYANMHEDFMKGRITLIGCPKLDNIDYTEKLTAILANNDIKSVTVVRMEVPCCGGLAHAVRQALMNSHRMIPWNMYTITTDGEVIEE